LRLAANEPELANQGDEVPRTLLLIDGARLLRRGDLDQRCAIHARRLLLYPEGIDGEIPLWA
jgi:hypothetical protein